MAISTPRSIFIQFRVGNVYRSRHHKLAIDLERSSGRGNAFLLCFRLNWYYLASCSFGLSGGDGLGHDCPTCHLNGRIRNGRCSFWKVAQIFRSPRFSLEYLDDGCFSSSSYDSRSFLDTLYLKAVSLLRRDGRFLVRNSLVYWKVGVEMEGSNQVDSSREVAMTRRSWTSCSLRS